MQNLNVFLEFTLTLVCAGAAAMLVAVLAPRVPASRVRSIPDRMANQILIVSVMVFTLAFGTLAIMRHQSFHSGGFDLGIFDQNLWNSLHGRLFQASIPLKTRITLGQHFSPLLLAIIPLYSIWADARVLLALQTVGLALTALPLYWFARQQLGRGLALVITTALLLSPSLQSIALWEFHEIALVTPLLAFALYFLLNKRTFPCLVCLVLALLLKEEVGLIIAAFGFYFILIRRKRRLGFGLVASGIAWTGIMLLYIIPSFRDPIYGLDYQYVDRYEYLGRSVTEIASTIVTQPDLVLHHLLVPVKIEFVLQLLVPLVFTSFLGFEVLALGFPSLAYLLIGDNPFQNSIRFQYTAQILPFFFFAAVLGLKRFMTWSRSHSDHSSSSAFRRNVTLSTLILVATFANYYFQSPGPLGGHFDPRQYTMTEHTELGYQLMGSIPSDAAVLADAGLVAHMAHRPQIYEASIQDPPNLRQVEYIFTDLTIPVHRDFPIIWDDILASAQFQTILERDGYIIKKRAVPNVSHTTQIRFDDRIALLGYTVESGEPAIRGDNVRIILAWRAEQKVHDRCVAFVHLVGPSDQIVAQDDHEPSNGWLRTDRWDGGDVTLDRFILELPPDLQKGTYRITTGFYRVSDQQNLPARDALDNGLGVAPEIGTLTLK